MLISEYTKEYTADKGIYFKDVWSEIKEFFIEILKLNMTGIKEEFGDVFHFLQLWLYSQYKIDGQIWRITDYSVNKFIDRKKVWQEIYEFVGLDKNISGYVGNYKKSEKVVKQLSKFNVNSEKAEAAYNSIVLRRIPKISP